MRPTSSVDSLDSKHHFPLLLAISSAQMSIHWSLIRFETVLSRLICWSLYMFLYDVHKVKSHWLIRPVFICLGMKQQRIFLFPLDGMLVCRRLHPQAIVGTHLYSWVERSSYGTLYCSRTQAACLWPGFEPTFWRRGNPWPSGLVHWTCVLIDGWVVGMWVRILAATVVLVSLSKTLYCNCFSSPRSINGVPVRIEMVD